LKRTAASRLRADAGNRIKITPGKSIRAASNSQPKSLPSVSGIVVPQALIGGLRGGKT